MNLNLTLPILAKIIQPLNQVTSEDWTKEKVTGVNTDTRHLQMGEVFVALVGDKFDGHKFVERALEAGASALILNRNFSGKISSAVSQFYVENTLVAYQKIAHWWREQIGRASCRERVYTKV